jgi:hypothetical protein
VRDSHSYPDQCGDPDVALTEEQKASARWVICGYAHDTDDAVVLMMACGIHPSQDDDEVYVTKPPGMHNKMCR